MGLFKFIKSAGEKLFGASEAKAAEPDALKQEAAKHGLDVGGLQVHVDGDKVKVTGTAKSTEEAEKIILAMGNTLGVDQIQSELIVNKETPAATFVTVQKGDTLWAIAEKSYGKGHGKDFNKIFEANRPMLTHPDKIYPGQVLRVPPLA
ncbi:peptidoglycan-binding protein LysM [Nostoc sp. NIES-2111]